MNMKKFKKTLQSYPVFNAKKKSCWKNPLFLTLFIVGTAIVLAVAIIGIVKWTRRDEDILDEDWLLDDDDDVLFFPNDNESFTMEDEE